MAYLSGVSLAYFLFFCRLDFYALYFVRHWRRIRSKDPKADLWGSDTPLRLRCGEFYIMGELARVENPRTSGNVRAQVEVIPTLQFGNGDFA